MASETIPLKAPTGNPRNLDSSLEEADAALKDLEYGTSSQDKTDPDTTTNKPGDYSVGDAIDSIGLGCLQIAILLMSCLAMIAFFAEVLLTTTINEILRCTFKLTDDQVALISTMLFVGELIGTYPISKFLDTYGRRPGMILISTLLLVYSMLLAAAPNYTWVLLMRLLAGVCCMGMQVSYVLYLGEITPSTFRAPFLLGQVLSFGIGSVYVATLGYLVVPTLGWRFQCFFAALPSVPVMIAPWFFPESPRYFALTGNINSAVSTIKSIAASNNKELPEGQLIQATIHTKETGSVLQLLSRELSRQTIMLWFTWFSIYFCYLGIALSSGRLIRITSPLPPSAANESLSSALDPNSTMYLPKWPAGDIADIPVKIASVETTLPQHLHVHTPPRMTAATCAEEDQEPVECEVIVSNSEYVDSLVASIGDFVAAPCILFLVFAFGRKGGMAIALMLAAAFMLCIVFTLGEISPTAFIFLTRAMTLGSYGGVVLYTLEAYPTSTRSIALASGQFLAKVGGALTPFVAESFIKQSPQEAILIYFFVSVFGAISICLLPPETEGMDLKEL